MFNVYDEIEETASMMAQYAGRAAAFPSFRGYFHTGAGRMSSRIFALFGSADTPCSADEGFRRFGSTAVDGGGSCITDTITHDALAPGNDRCAAGSTPYDVPDPVAKDRSGSAGARSSA